MVIDLVAPRNRMAYNVAQLWLAVHPAKRKEDKICVLSNPSWTKMPRSTLLVMIPASAVEASRAGWRLSCKSHRDGVLLNLVCLSTERVCGGHEPCPGLPERAVNRRLMNYLSYDLRPASSRISEPTSSALRSSVMMLWRAW